MAHFEFLMAFFARRWRHPERSRSSGGAKDLRYDAVCHGRSLGPLVKTRALRDDAFNYYQTEALDNLSEADIRTLYTRAVYREIFA